jgi:hypothetical protein
MHPHHASTTFGVAPSFLLSLTHLIIQLTSAASARAGVTDDAMLKLARTAKDTALPMGVTSVHELG